jgi:CHAT domain-containing protein
VFDQDHYLDSGLVLRVTDEPLRREILSLRDLMSWRLSCDLAVLSACETGRGKPAPSGFLGLGRGFLAAGSRSVLVALWSIDNMATQDFMLSFYANVRQQKEEGTQMNVAEALRRTQLAYAASTPLYDWAGFKLIGWPYMDQMESME